MTLAHARALLQGRMHVAPHEPEADLAALHRLARWVVRFAPGVAVDPPDGLLLDVTGCQRLYGGEPRLARLLHQALYRLGFACQLAIAPTVGAAWALARHSPLSLPVIEENAIEDALAPLPVAALRSPADVVQALAEVGVVRVEQLLDLPREQLADRFGMDLLRRMDQALGRAAETIDPVRVVEPVFVERTFDGPVKQLEAIEHATRDLVGRLCHALLVQGVGVLTLCLRAARSDLPPVEEQVCLSHPSRSEKHLWALLRPKVERLQMGYGVDAIELRARDVAWLPAGQQAFEQVETPAPPVGQGQQEGRLVDLLINRLGARHVLHADPVDTHVPEKAFAWRSAEEPPARTSTCDSTVPAFSSMAHRPTLLLDRPRPVQVVMLHPEGPLLQVQGEASWRVLTSVGPERIALRWWRMKWPAPSPPDTEKAAGEAPPSPLAWTGGERDYYRLQIEGGRWIWVFRERMTQRWFLHGMWE